MEHFDCIVLGAGIAGLSAAQELAARGLSVVVLESRNRVGGRLHTAEIAPGLPALDLGGAWIHGLGSPSSLNSIYALALRCGLQVRTTDYNDAVYFDCTSESRYTQLPPDAVDRLTDAYRHFAAFVSGIVARQPAAKASLSVDQAVQLYAQACGGLSEGAMRELLFQVHNEIESYWAGDGSAMSIGTMDEVRLPGADAVLCGGYGQLVQFLAAGLDIRTGMQVARVTWSPPHTSPGSEHLSHPCHTNSHTNSHYNPQGRQQSSSSISAAAAAAATQSNLYSSHHVSHHHMGLLQRQRVKVETACGAVFHAPRVIITLPLGVLQSGSVAFNPPLPLAAPAKAAALSRLGTGMYNKVVLVFDNAFWDDAVMIHRIPAAEERGRWAWILNLHRVLGLPALVAFTTGSFALEMEQLPDEAVAEELLAVLRRMYPGRVAAPRHVVCTRWGSDPHSRMSYTFIPVGSDTEDCEQLRTPLASQLYWAGEATSRLFYGTVHGAYGTGLQAAAEVAAAHEAETIAAATAAAAAVGAVRSDGVEAARAAEAATVAAVTAAMANGAGCASSAPLARSVSKPFATHHALPLPQAAGCEAGCISMAATSASRPFSAASPTAAVAAVPLCHASGVSGQGGGQQQQLQQQQLLPLAAASQQVLTTAAAAQQLPLQESKLPQGLSMTPPSGIPPAPQLSMQPAASRGGHGIDRRMAQAGRDAWTAAPQLSAMHAWSIASSGAYAGPCQGAGTSACATAGATAGEGKGSAAKDSVVAKATACSNAVGIGLPLSPNPCAGSGLPYAAIGQRAGAGVAPVARSQQQQQQPRRQSPSQGGQGRAGVGPWSRHSKPVKPGLTAGSAAAAGSDGDESAGAAAGCGVMLMRNPAVGRSRALAAVSRL